MPLMGSLYVGVSGLQTSQNSLNTTAHNLSNMDTKGYTRQQALQGTRPYNTISLNTKGISNQQIGLGTYYSKVRQCRDYFLDQTYRRETGRCAYFEQSATSLEEVETLLGEMEGASFKVAMNDLWEAVQELSKNPAGSVNQGLLVNRASAFLERAKSVYEGLNDYQNNLNLQVKNDVDKINYYGKQLKQLNDEIRKVESHGIESANDLRDARNQILDELSALAKISYEEGPDTTVSVQIEGVDFVKCDTVYEIGLQTDPITGFHTPFWKQNAKPITTASGETVYNIEGAEVFNNLHQEISSAKGTDIGSLRAKLMARGDRVAKYTDLNPATYGEIENSLIMNVQAEFDNLIHNVATKINAAIAKFADPTNGGYLCEEVNGQMIPLQLFQKRATAGYDPAMANQPGYDADGYMLEDEDRPETLYTTNNLIINPLLVKEPNRLDLIKPNGDEDMELGAALKEVFDEEIYTLNPKMTVPCNLASYYNNLVSQVAINGSIMRNMTTTQEAELESIDYAREGVIGVSSEEELSNMIKFQNAYNAASRYINVVDEMLEHILNTLGS